MSYITQSLQESIQILKQIDTAAMEKIVQLLVRVRERGGRIFFIGVGGSAANASHAVNDARKIAGIEAYAPTDNISELTARINDDGWNSSFANWLKGSRLSHKDLIFVFSVGGGSEEKQISVNIVEALKLAQRVGATICGVVGRDGGYTAQVADACVIVPTVNPKMVTPYTESFHVLIWHLLISHPHLQVTQMKWESVVA